jgi:hypothetical protein
MNLSETLAALHQRALTAPVHEAAQICEQIRQLNERGTAALPFSMGYPANHATGATLPPQGSSEPPTPKQMAIIKRFRYSGPVRSKAHAAEIIDKLFGNRKGAKR